MCYNICNFLRCMVGLICVFLNMCALHVSIQTKLHVVTHTHSVAVKHNRQSRIVDTLHLGVAL